MGCKFVFALAAICLFVGITSAATDKVVCYYGSWSTYRLGNGKFTANNIDPTLCTHVIYSFVGLNDDGSVKLLDEYLEATLGNLAKVSALKQINPKLKTLIAIGGWNEGSVKYSNVAVSATKRATLISSALSLVKKYNYDGFDLDWEYPGQRGGSTADIANYVTLIKEFREVWDKNGLLLTAAVAASGSSVDLSYNVPALSKYLDLIHVMTYDLHGAWEGVTGQNAPLYASSKDVTAAQKLLNVASAIQGWIDRGAAPEKLALGLGVYGRSYTLSSSSNTALGAPVTNVGNAGPYTLESGMLGYNEICELQLQGGWTTVWDDEQKVPYTYKENQWVGYDNPKSIAAKVEFAKNLNLGGVMIWSIETDDFLGKCGTKYPILNAIKSALGGESIEDTDNENDNDDNSGSNSGSENDNGSSNSQTEATTTNTGECTKNGYIRDPSNCNVFYYCMLVGNSYVKYRQQCQTGLYFNEAVNSCDWASNVSC